MDHKTIELKVLQYLTSLLQTRKPEEAMTHVAFLVLSYLLQHVEDPEELDRFFTVLDTSRTTLNEITSRKVSEITEKWN